LPSLLSQTTSSNTVTVVESTTSDRHHTLTASSIPTLSPSNTPSASNAPTSTSTSLEATNTPVQSSAGSSKSATVKVLIGIGGAAAIIIIIFTIALFLVRRGAKAKLRGSQDGRNAVYQAAATDDDYSGDRSRFLSMTRRQSEGDDARRSESERPSLQGRSQDSYLRPGLYQEEAYQLFNRDSNFPIPDAVQPSYLNPARGSDSYTDPFPATSSPTRPRRSSILDDGSRYPAPLQSGGEGDNSQPKRRSINLPAISTAPFDPFADLIPSSVPKPSTRG